MYYQNIALYNLIYLLQMNVRIKKLFAINESTRTDEIFALVGALDIVRMGFRKRDELFFLFFNGYISIETN